MKRLTICGNQHNNYNQLLRCFDWFENDQRVRASMKDEKFEIVPEKFRNLSDGFFSETISDDSYF